MINEILFMDGYGIYKAKERTDQMNEGKIADEDVSMEQEDQNKHLRQMSLQEKEEAERAQRLKDLADQNREVMLTQAWRAREGDPNR